MAGGIIQLAAYGVQDLYLTGDPQITYFKAVYRRHTNFAIESIPQYFSTKADFGSQVSCPISRMGDLVGQIHLRVELPAIPNLDNRSFFRWVDHLGYVLLDEAIVEIGGRKIDKHYGEWLYIWSQLTDTDNAATNRLIGNVPQLTTLTNGKKGYELYIPLRFWFCRFTGLSLPLVALAASDVNIIIKFKNLTDCCIRGPTHSITIMEDISPFEQGDYIEQVIDGQVVKGYVMGFDYHQRKLYYNRIEQSKLTFQSLSINSNHQAQIPDWHLDLDILTESNKPHRIYRSKTSSDNFLTFVTPQPGSTEVIESLPHIPINLIDSQLLVDYIYLDTEERRKFATTHHEYLIEQLQIMRQPGITSPYTKINLKFKHPIKSLYWTAALSSHTRNPCLNDWFNYRDDSDNSLIIDSKLQLNGRDRQKTRGYEYYNWYQPYIHHHRGPVSGINTYSFSLYPENHQPSSALNMSLIDQASLHLRLNSMVSSRNPVHITVWALNYNILRISCGLGGVGFV